jgi:hypothetical protein
MAARSLGRGDAHRVGQPAAGQPAEQLMRAPGAIDADQHVLARPAPAGQLGQRGAQHGDVVDDGVRAGVARPQQERQGLPGALLPVVEERPQWVEDEAALERRCGGLLRRVRAHQGGVHIDHHRPRGVRVVVGGIPAGQRPGGRPRGRPRRGDRGQRGRGVGGERVDQPGHRRIRGDRAERLRGGPQLRQIGQGVPADRQVHRQIHQHLARIVPRDRPPPGRERIREGAGQTHGLRGAQQEHRAGVRHDTRAPPIHCQGRVPPATLLHQKGAPVRALIRS